MVKKTDYDFYKILYVLWQLACYYADYMGFSAPPSPLDLNIKIVRRQRLSFFRVTLPSICVWDDRPSIPTYGKMQEILQEYLAIELLPASGLFHYEADEASGHITEKLYIDAVYPDGCPDMPHNLIWEILYIDRPLAYRYYIQRCAGITSLPGNETIETIRKGDEK